MLVGCGQRLAVIQHTHQWQDLISQTLVLIYHSAEVLPKMPQL